MHIKIPYSGWKWVGLPKSACQHHLAAHSFAIPWNKFHVSPWEKCIYSAALLDPGLAVQPLMTPRSWALELLWPAVAEHRGVLAVREQPQGKKQETGTVFRTWLLAWAWTVPSPPRQALSSGQSQAPEGDLEHFEEGTQSTPVGPQNW